MSLLDANQAKRFAQILDNICAPAFRGAAEPPHNVTATAARWEQPLFNSAGPCDRGAKAQQTSGGGGSRRPSFTVRTPAGAACCAKCYRDWQTEIANVKIADLNIWMNSRDVTQTGRAAVSQLTARGPWGRAGPGRSDSTDIRIECFADACLCGLFRGRRGQQLCALRCILVAQVTSSLTRRR